MKKLYRLFACIMAIIVALTCTGTYPDRLRSNISENYGS